MQSLLRAGQFYACFMENIKAEFGLKLNKRVLLSYPVLVTLAQQTADSISLDY